MRVRRTDPAGASTAPPHPRGGHRALPWTASKGHASGARNAPAPHRLGGPAPGPNPCRMMVADVLTADNGRLCRSFWVPGRQAQTGLPLPAPGGPGQGDQMTNGAAVPPHTLPRCRPGPSRAEATAGPTGLSEVRLAVATGPGRMAVPWRPARGQPAPEAGRPWQFGRAVPSRWPRPPRPRQVTVAPHRDLTLACRYALQWTRPGGDHGADDGIGTTGGAG